ALALAPFGSMVVDGSTPANAALDMSATKSRARAETTTSLRFVTRMIPPDSGTGHSHPVREAADARVRARSQPRSRCRRGSVGASDAVITQRAGFTTGSAL